jgi:hypothetical protein
MNPQRAYRLGLLLVTLSALVWSTAGLFTRIISVDTPTMLLWRGIFGSLGFFAYMLFQEGFGAFGRLNRMDRRAVSMRCHLGRSRSILGIRKAALRLNGANGSEGPGTLVVRLLALKGGCRPAA